MLLQCVLSYSYLVSCIFHYCMSARVCPRRNSNIFSVLMCCNTQLPYIGNHSRKKSFVNYLLCHSLQGNFCNSGNLIYENSSQIEKCKKTLVNASRFAKFTFSSADNSHYTLCYVCGCRVKQLKDLVSYL